MYGKNIIGIIRRAFDAAIRAGQSISFQNPVEWAIKNISFKQDKTAFVDKLDLSLTPYLIPLIKYWDFSGKIQEMTVVAPQQMGKSLGSWMIGLLWSFKNMPCLSMVIYPSDDKAEKINQDKFIPMMKEIPALNEELQLPKTKQKDCFRFSAFVSYFQGSGARISSYPAKIRIAEELDDWQYEEDAAPKIEDLRIRARSFDESLFVKNSSPKGSYVDKDNVSSKIWREFLKSSQGYWHLCCLNCGKLSIRSCDIHNLQFETTEDDEIIQSSLRIVCPECKHEHPESDKREMNLKGDYIHLYPDRYDYHAGFQWGALASQRNSLSWLNIAEAQLEAGRTAEVKTQIFFDNCIRGLPHKQRKGTDAERSKVLSHCAPMPDPAILEGVFISADTQDNGWYYIIRGIDGKENTYKLAEGNVKTLTDLENLKLKGWGGIACLAGIIDEGGHKAVEVQRFVESHKGWYSYKGGSMYKERFRLSDNKTKLIWAISKQYQSDLLYYIYQQDKRENSYWYLPPEVSETYLKHILDMRPDKKKKSGNLYENWEGTGDDHYFDCEKMMIVVLDFAKKHFRPSEWRAGKGTWIKRKKITIIKSANASGGFVAGWNK